MKRNSDRFQRSGIVSFAFCFFCTFSLCIAGDSPENSISLNNGNHKSIVIEGWQKRYEAIKLENMYIVINGFDDCDGVQNVIYRNISRLRRVLVNRIEEIDRCDKFRMPESAAPRGCAGFRLMVNGLGRVTGCEVIESTMDDSVLLDSLRSEIVHWEFPSVDQVSDSMSLYFPFCCGNFGSFRGTKCNGVRLIHGK